MTYRVNGFGTGVVRASRSCSYEGIDQYDALEAVTLAYIPVIPYKVIHIGGTWSEGWQSTGYQAFPLRYAPRVIIKGMMNAWANIAMLFCSLMLAIAIYAFCTMARPVNANDYAFVAVFSFVLFAGVFLKLVYWLVDARDHKIKQIIGPHDLGSSDPFYWPEPLSVEVRQSILQELGKPNLVDAARDVLMSGDLSTAMYYVRLAQRLPLSGDSNALLHQIIQQYNTLPPGPMQMSGQLNQPSDFKGQI